MKVAFRLFILVVVFNSACSQRSNSTRQAGSPAASPADPSTVPAGTDTNSMAGERGNGAEEHSDFDNTAWFSDKHRTIRYCVQISPQFGRSGSEVTKVVSAVFSKWADYLDQIKSNRLEKCDAEIPLSTQSELLPSCDGSEDIQILFGVRTPEVEKALPAFQNPWAFSKRTSYDYASRWGKGIVWIREQGGLGRDTGDRPIPDWSALDKIEGILLHEFGHIYGNGHVPGTIMRADITKRMESLIFEDLNDPARRAKYTQSIDQESQLYSPYCGKSVHPGKIGVAVFDRSHDKENAISLFQLLAGRKPVGSFAASVTHFAYKNVNLALRDSKGNLEFKFTMVDDSLIETCETQILFKILEGPKSRESGGGTTCFSYLADLKLSDGSVRRVQISYNQDLGIHQPSTGSVLFSNVLSIRFAESSSNQLVFVSTF